MQTYESDNPKVRLDPSRSDDGYDMKVEVADDHGNPVSLDLGHIAPGRLAGAAEISPQAAEEVLRVVMGRLGCSDTYDLAMELDGAHGCSSRVEVGIFTLEELGELVKSDPDDLALYHAWLLGGARGLWHVSETRDIDEVARPTELLDYMGGDVRALAAEVDLKVLGAHRAAGGVSWHDVASRAMAQATYEASFGSLEALGAKTYLEYYVNDYIGDPDRDEFRASFLDAVREANPDLAGEDLQCALASALLDQARSHFVADLDWGAERFSEVAYELNDVGARYTSEWLALARERQSMDEAEDLRALTRKETPIGTLVVRDWGGGEDYSGFAIDLEKPDGTCGQVAMVEALGEAFARGGDYPTRLQTLAWNGADEDPTNIPCKPDGPFMSYKRQERSDRAQRAQDAPER